jgi:predicted AlkP superfamily phosphohydrolase/phosphomutase
MNSAPAWSSFATGVRPGKHGIFYFTEIPEGTYCRRLVNAADRKALPFWRYLSQRNISVGVVNVPISFPAESVKGFLVAGMDAPRTGAEGFSYSKNFFNSVAGSLADSYIIEPMIGRMMRERDYAAAMEIVRTALQVRLEFIKRAVAQNPVEVLVAVFTAADVAQHFFWRFMDQDHPQYDESVSDEVSNFVKEIYHRLDSAVGDLMDLTSPDLVVLLSDHGAGFNQRGGDFLYEWLLKVGLLKERSIGRQLNLFNLSCPGETRPWPILRNVAWRRTRAYVVGTDNIYLNLRSREPRGKVNIKSKDALLKQIVDLLRQSTDPVTGEPVVDYVATAMETYDGPYAGHAPDITIRWRTQHVLNGIVTPGFEPVVADGPVPLINGGHRLFGTIVVSGQGIEARETLLDADIVDVAPTLLYWLGLSIPASYDGQVLMDAFAPDWRAAHPLIYVDYTEDVETLREPSENSRMVEDRLRDLGYID